MHKQLDSAPTSPTKANQQAVDNTGKPGIHSDSGFNLSQRVLGRNDNVFDIAAEMMYPWILLPS